MIINRKKLDSIYYLTVENISFASDAIGAASGTGRAAASSWAQDDEVIFKGRLKDILTFAVMAFSVNSTAILETFDIVPEREYYNVPNLTENDIVVAIDLDPTENEGIVLADDLTFLQNLTQNFRLNWTDIKNIRMEEKVAPTNKLLYRGSVLETLAYNLQYQNAGIAPIYTLYNVATSETGYNKGVIWETMTGANGPIELEAAHMSLAQVILGV